MCILFEESLERFQPRREDATFIVTIPAPQSQGPAVVPEQGLRQELPASEAASGRPARRFRGSLFPKLTLGVRGKRAEARPIRLPCSRDTESQNSRGWKGPLWVI